jgi:hypothetical protein
MVALWSLFEQPEISAQHAMLKTIRAGTVLLFMANLLLLGRDDNVVSC